MHRSDDSKRRLTVFAAGGAALGALVILVMLKLGDPADIIKQAVKISRPELKEGQSYPLQQAIDGAGALVEPAQIFMLAAAPLGIIAGGAATMAGSRKGLFYVYSAVGGLLLISVANGIIA
jgi:hypothetical protein